jgi:hypothetical protein
MSDTRVYRYLQAQAEAFLAAATGDADLEDDRLAEMNELWYAMTEGEIESVRRATARLRNGLETEVEFALRTWASDTRYTAKPTLIGDIRRAYRAPELSREWIEYTRQPRAAHA